MIRKQLQVYADTSKNDEKSFCIRKWPLHLKNPDLKFFLPPAAWAPTKKVDKANKATKGFI